MGDYVHDDVVVNGEPVGLAGYAAGLRDVVAGFADYHWELRRLVSDVSDVSEVSDGLGSVGDGWLAVHLHDTGTHTGTVRGIPPTGRRIETEEYAFYRLRDGRIAEVWVTADNERVLEQLRR